ncbi:hypothetical protein AVEN_233400-1, partial [Araneus ventricosus]
MTADDVPLNSKGRKGNFSSSDSSLRVVESEEKPNEEAKEKVVRQMRTVITSDDVPLNQREERGDKLTTEHRVPDPPFSRTQDKARGWAQSDSLKGTPRKIRLQILGMLRRTRAEFLAIC